MTSRRFAVETKWTRHPRRGDPPTGRGCKSSLGGRHDGPCQGIGREAYLHLWLVVGDCCLSRCEKVRIRQSLSASVCASHPFAETDCRHCLHRYRRCLTLRPCLRINCPPLPKSPETYGPLRIQLLDKLISLEKENMHLELLQSCRLVLDHGQGLSDGLQWSQPRTTTISNVSASCGSYSFAHVPPFRKVYCLRHRTSHSDSPGAESFSSRGSTPLIASS